MNHFFLIYPPNMHKMRGDVTPGRNIKDEEAFWTQRKERKSCKLKKLALLSAEGVGGGVGLEMHGHEDPLRQGG